MFFFTKTCNVNNGSFYDFPYIWYNSLTLNKPYKNMVTGERSVVETHETMMRQVFL